MVLAIFFLVYTIYSLDAGELIYEYALDVIIIILVCYLLWRVETLSDLNPLQPQILPINEESDSLAIQTDTTENVEDNDLSLSIRNNIGPLLKKHCEDTQLYLQYDISLSQLAKQVGINRSYLSKHFAKQGITYNAYINGLRIQHFIKWKSRENRSLYGKIANYDSRGLPRESILITKNGIRSWNYMRLERN